MNRVVLVILLLLTSGSAMAARPLNQAEATLFARCSGVVDANIERGRNAGVARESLMQVALYSVLLQGRAEEVLGAEPTRRLVADAKQRDLEYDAEEEDDTAPGLPSIDECLELRHRL